jgi:hypothetical protein
MQFRFQTNLTAEEYVRVEAWKDVRICHCLIHSGQDCRVSRHGTYPRVFPPGTKIVRFLCNTKKATFSLLPDCFSSRLPGTLVDLETVVFMVEVASRREGAQAATDGDISLHSLDIASAADELDVDRELFDSAADLGWLKRRVDYVRKFLSVVITLFPELFHNCLPSITSFRSVLGSGPILVQMRAVAEARLHEIPPPLGLNPRRTGIQEIKWKPP